MSDRNDRNRCADGAASCTGTTSADSASSDGSSIRDSGSTVLVNSAATCSVCTTLSSGPASVTIASVSAASGAPSGSLYHRFPNRPALQAALMRNLLASFYEVIGRMTREVGSLFDGR